MRLDRLKAGDFFKSKGVMYIRLENCNRHIGAVNAIRLDAPGMKCIWGELEVRHVTRIRITEE